MGNRAHGALVLGFILPNDIDIDKDQYFNNVIEDDNEEDEDDVCDDEEEKFQFISSYSDEWEEDDILFIKRIESQEYEIIPISPADLIISDEDRWALETEAEKLGIDDPEIRWHLVSYLC